MYRNLTNDQKAQLYNKMLNQFQRLQEQVRLIKAEDMNISPENQRKIDFLENEMKKVYNETKKLY